ncbi:MAG: hypothetical protein EP330_18220 [Deltaproteobacteria bacterium]|nr:MAG: hypothetical protein EP330_18220 [Deltaproteobacteria bacterium]
MQKWWIGAVAVAAVVLAVLLIGSPDTGGEVTEREFSVPDIPEPSDDGTIIRGGGAVTSGGSPYKSPAAVPLDENGDPLPLDDLMAAKPGSREILLRRQQPEAQWAARTMAPWTQIRREIANQDKESPLIAEVNGLIGEIRELRRDPANRDFDTILEQQAAMRAKVEASGLVNGEIESMLALIDERKEAYDNGDYSPEMLKAAAEGKE